MKDKLTIEELQELLKFAHHAGKSGVDFNEFYKTAFNHEAQQYHYSNDSAEGLHYGTVREIALRTFNEFMPEYGDSGLAWHVYKRAFDIANIHLQKQHESDAWISVEDEVPTLNKFICYPSYTVFRQETTGHSPLSWIKAYGDSHWMPLPKSPTIQIKQ